MNIEPRFIQRPHLYLGRLLSKVLFTMYFTGCAVHGREEIPPVDEPYILALNETAAVDGALVMAFFPDPIYFVARRDWYQHPLLGWICRRAGMVPATGNRLPVGTARLGVRYLREFKRNLALFINRSGGSDDTGLLCALLANRTGAKVLPAFISGTAGLAPRVVPFVPCYSNQLAIHIGKPLSLGKPGAFVKRDLLVEQTNQIAAAIAALDPKSR